ncbi:carbon monoxide dehydrogenase subunit G [Sandarakinorhabdus sp.]|uniref:CoxG family protein n=1 Tax=Sandarakinorhabdus sp. TaxID=1916663 RepID=UPI00286DD788|nr:carbon monoxide dehydrogenase subunit G [Sandarakinorhabdus sp.]
MQLEGEVSIGAARDAVWAALNDSDVLARCIDGVESLTRVASGSGEQFEGRMNARIGPVRATFAGTVRLEDVVAPQSYRLVGEGKGGVAGFAKGSADVALVETSANKTLLTYRVESSVGGKLAQLGARLIEGAAKQYAETFFARLKAELENPTAPAEAEAVPETIPVGPAAPATGLAPVIWGGGLILVVVAFLFWQWG